MTALPIIATACIAYAWHRERVRRANVEAALTVARQKLSAGGRARARNLRAKQAQIQRERTEQLRREIAR